MSQGFGYDGGVFLGPGLEAKLGVTAGAYEALRSQFEKAGGEHLAVGQLFAHVYVVHPPGKDKGHGLTGKVFNYEVFHEASSAVLAFAPVLQVLAHGLVVVRKVGGKNVFTAVGDSHKIEKIVLFRLDGGLEGGHAE